MMNLNEKLHKLRENRSITEYFQQLRSIADDLALINAHAVEVDLVVYALNGIGNEFKEIVMGIRARETAFSLKSSLRK